MKKLIGISLFTCFVLLSAFSMPANSGHKIKIPELKESIIGSQEFYSYFNEVISFTKKISDLKLTETLQKINRNQATILEKQLFFDKLGYHTEEIFFQELKKLDSKRAEFIKKHDAELKSSNFKTILEESLIEAGKKGKFTAIKVVPIDCWVFTVAAIAACYIALEYCQSDTPWLSCFGLWDTCIFAAYMAYDTCFY